MKPQDIMIGDWVYVSKNFTQKYHKIRALSNDEDDVLRGIYINEYGVENCSVFSPNDTEPIPLTPEILEKNGFKWLLTDSKSITYCINKPTINASKNKESGEWLICVGPSGSTKKRFVEISCVKYVHELQHALRLCKVEKEIVL